RAESATVRSGRSMATSFRNRTGPLRRTEQRWFFPSFISPCSLFEYGEHRLMIGRIGPLIDLHFAQARQQIIGREYEIATKRFGPLLAIVHAKRQRMRRIRMPMLPHIDEAARVIVIG